jgi:hypothetical protein
MRQDFKFLEAPPILNKKLEIPCSKRKTYAGSLCLKPFLATITYVLNLEYNYPIIKIAARVLLISSSVRLVNGQT